MVARSEWRRRWRAILALGLLAGIAGAVLLAAAQLERRTATAYPRLQETTGLDDARLAIPPGPAGAQFAALPPVRSAWPGTLTVSQLDGPGVVYISIAAGPPRPPDLLQPIVLSGRLPADDRPDEILLGEEMARQTGVGVGAELPLKMLTTEEFEQFDTGFGEPDGPRLSVRVVGIGRFPGWGTGLGNVLGTPAFAERYAAYSPGGVLLLRLKDEPDARARLEAGVAGILDGQDVPISEAQGPPGPTYSRPGDPSVLATQALLSQSLRVFLGIAIVASLLTVLQATSRYAAQSVEEQRVEASLGMTRRERRLARLLPALPAAALAAVTAVAGGLASAGRLPLGSLAAYEPHPGWVPNVGLLIVGGVAVALAFLIAVALTAAPALRQVSAPAPRTVRGLPLLRRRAIGAAGGAFALSPGSGRSAAPIRSGVIGVVVGVAGLIASLVFGASADRLADSPDRYGWAADVVLIDAKDPDVARLGADPRVRDLDLVEESTVRVGEADVPVLGRTLRKGEPPWSTVRGRLPVAVDEVAVGPHLARRLDVTVGDVVPAITPAGTVRELTVVGVSFIAPQSQEPLGSSMVVTQQTLEGLRDAPGFVSALVRGTPGSAPALVDELGATAEIGTPALPVEVRNLRDLGSLPLLLGLFYAAVGAAALLHSLVVTSRRRTRDLGVLRALGFDSGQVLLTVVVMAGTMVGSGLLLAVPLGVGVGRVVWTDASAEIGAGAAAVVPLGQLAVVVVVALLLALAAAAVVGYRATRRTPAASLRAE
jgi:hypothetical protein